MPDKQIIGNIGLHYVSYRLSLLGWNVMQTSRNAKGVDLIAYGNNAKKMISIQVKTLGKRNHVPACSSEKVMGDYWIIVTNAKTENEKPILYVLKASEVKKKINTSTNKATGKKADWIKLAEYEQTQYREALNRLGSPE